MRAAVVSHCVIDTITVGGATYERPGGPACYGGIAARRLGFDVELHTRFGPDFAAAYLEEHGIRTDGCRSERPTTRFAIDIAGASRTLKLGCECEPVGYAGSDADAHLVGPAYREIPPGAYSQIRRDASFLLVDPQGFLREAGEGGAISLRGSGPDLAGVGAVKVGLDEAACMAPGTPGEAMAALHRRGAEHVLLTDGTEVSMLSGGRMYSITLPNKEVRDTTGVGDIFSAAFCCTMVKERDALWALCFAGGAAQAALDSREVGLGKVPGRGAVQTNASYFYNLVRFREV